MKSYQNFLLESQTRFVSVIEDSPYFLWQQEIQCHHFNEKYPLLEMDVVILQEGGRNPSEWAKHIQKTNNVYYFNIDNDVQKIAESYKPFYKSYGTYLYTKESNTKNFCLLDSDMVLNRIPNFEDLYKNDMQNFADWTYHLSYDYLKKFLSDAQILKMCTIVGIQFEQVKELKMVGGSPMFFKNIEPFLFKKIAYDGKNIYTYLSSLKNKGNNINHWVSEMWSFAWNVELYFGVNVNSDLTYCMAYDDINQVNKTMFTHFTCDVPPGSFNKNDYKNINPIHSDMSTITVKDNCAYYWTQLIKRYKKLCYKNEIL